MTMTGMESPATVAFMEINDRMHGAMAIDYTGNVDVDFVKGMIPHHQGAVEMAKIELANGTDPEVRKLAEAVIAAQEAEIAWMQALAGPAGAVVTGRDVRAGRARPGGRAIACRPGDDGGGSLQRAGAVRNVQRLHPGLHHRQRAQRHVGVDMAHVRDAQKAVDLPGRRASPCPARCPASRRPGSRSSAAGAWHRARPAARR